MYIYSIPKLQLFISFFFLKNHYIEVFICAPQLWVNERLPMAMSEDQGNNLQTVQLLLKKNQVSFNFFPVIPTNHS